eukprot:12203317-Alexandrium_andersonii.AAC.1
MQSVGGRLREGIGATSSASWLTELESTISEGVPQELILSASVGWERSGEALKIQKGSSSCYRQSGPRANGTGRSACSRKSQISSWLSARLDMART